MDGDGPRCSKMNFGESGSLSCKTYASKEGSYEGSYFCKVGRVCKKRKFHRAMGLFNFLVLTSSKYL